MVTNATNLWFSASLFSSPDHEVVMVSFWDHAMSGGVVRRASSVVRKLFLVNTVEATFFIRSLWYLYSLFISMRPRSLSKMARIGSLVLELSALEFQNIAYFTLWTQYSLQFSINIYEIYTVYLYSWDLSPFRKWPESGHWVWSYLPLNFQNSAYLTLCTQ